MLLAEPPATPYDLHLRLGPVDVRVAPFFWIAAALLGWDLAAGVDRDLEGSPGAGVWLLLWIAAVFVSILVHELGHWLAMRRYGIDASIVLYHFGGLAIPRGGSRYASRGNQLVISAAGPAAQLALAVALVISLHAAGYRVLGLPLPDFVLAWEEGAPLPTPALDVLVYFLVVPSIFWALLNLLPVYPLDGGQIAREILLRWDAGNGVRQSLMLSVAAAGLIAAYAFLVRNEPFLGIMFAVLAYSSYQTLQSYGGYGGRRW